MQLQENSAPASVRWIRVLMLLCAATLLFSACSEDTEPVPYQPTDCDPIDPSACALPWPSNLYLIANDDSQTGVTLQLGETSLPANKRGPTKPDGWNGLDGYGVSTPILFKAANLDLDGLPSEDNPRDSWDGDIGKAALLKVEDDGTLTRVPFWIERDLRGEPGESVFYMRPTVVLDENAHYIVMLRNLTNTDGNRIERSSAFDKLVRNTGDQDPELSGRQAHFNAIFDALDTLDIDRKALFLAWDFHTMSHEDMHGTLLQGRAVVLDWLKDHNNAPAMNIANITVYQNTVPNPNTDDPEAPNYNPDALPYNPYIQYAFHGTFEAPQVVHKDGQGFLLNLDDDGNVFVDGTVARDFWVRVPYSAVGDSAQPADLMQYGHGLMNVGKEIRLGAQEQMAGTYNYIYFACNWTGMATMDAPAVISTLTDFSTFRYISDTMQQGVLEFMILAKAMKNSFFELDRLTQLEQDYAPIQVNKDQMFYAGNSQGGIYGPTYLAISPDIQYGQLGVPGINYSLLLPRSVDFTERYQSIMTLGYPGSSTNQDILLAAAQTLWDMVDPASWYRHLSVDPLFGTPKYVLLNPARGDHQVPPVSVLIAANSDVDLHVMDGWGTGGRNLDDWGITTQSYPYTGSGVTIFNVGNPWADEGNLPPSDEGDGPHSVIRFLRPLQKQADHFLQSGGEIIDVCDGKGCNFTKMDDAECSASIEPGTSTRQCYKLIDP